MAPKGTILLTGASGFVGGYIAREALERGYSVRGVARTEASGKKLMSQFPKYAGKLSYVVVQDITVADNYVGKLDGVTAIIHTASPFILAPKDNVTDLLDPAVKGATAVLDAALKYGTPALKRVVFTSSVAAIGDFAAGLNPGVRYTEADWNPITWEEAATTPSGSLAYCASKAFAERAMWDWFKAHPGATAFDLVAICPPWIFGPYATELTGTKSLSESIHAAYGQLGADAVRDPDFNGYADVREVAEAHMAALELPEAGGQRFLVGQDFNWQRAADATREALPELRDRMPEGTPGRWPDMWAVDGSKAARVLGVKYRTLGETFKDMYLQLLRAEKMEAGSA